MSASTKNKSKKTVNGRKPRQEDANLNGGGRSSEVHHEEVPTPRNNVNGASDDDLLKSRLAQRIYSMVYNHEPEEKLMDVISVLLEESTVTEVEMLREEVQNLKKMLRDATGMLQHVSKDRGGQGDKVVESASVEWEQKLQKEVSRQKKRYQEENKREMDKLRLYFEKQCSQRQEDYISEIYALKLECQETETLRGDVTKLQELCDEREKVARRLEAENDTIMKDVAQLKMDKLASEERTKKILSAVRDGLHKLSDMKSEPPTDTTQTPGLNTFYNYVEEVITSDDWTDDMYVKGVMEEIQVSVQKLSRPVRAPHTEVPEADPQRSAHETQISTMQENFLKEKNTLELSINDLTQQVQRLTEKTRADKRFIEELSADRESEREEYLKLVKTVEDSWRENEKHQERVLQLKQISEDLESQLRSAMEHTESLVKGKEALSENLQLKEDLLRQREEVVNELEKQLNDQRNQEQRNQRQMEKLKLELSGFLRSPSPERTLTDDFFMSFDDLRQQIMDLKDELEARNRINEAERDRRVTDLQTELERVRHNEQRAIRDCQVFQQQIEQQDLDIAHLRQQVDNAKFSFGEDEMVEDLRAQVNYLQREVDGCHRIIEQQESQLVQARLDLDSLKHSLDEKDHELDLTREVSVNDDISKRMGEFEQKNQALVEEMETTAEIWEEQQKSWEDDLAKKSARIAELEKELSEKNNDLGELGRMKQELQEVKKRLEQTELIAQDKSVQAQSFKNLIDIMKSETMQKDAAMKAIQKQFNDNSSSLARQLEEMELANSSLREEVDVLRNAPDRSVEIFEPLLKDKDAEISHLRDLLEASMDESFNKTNLEDCSVQTETEIELPVIHDDSFFGKQAETIEQADRTLTIAENEKVKVQSSGGKDAAVGADERFFTSAEVQTDVQPEINQESEHILTSSVIIVSGGNIPEAVPSLKITEIADEEAQTDLPVPDIDEVLTELTGLKATTRELEHSIVLKENQIEAMALELASLNDRHGKTQNKYRTTIRHLHQSGASSSSDEGSTSFMPRSVLNGDSKSLISKYESKIRDMEKTHVDEIHRIIQESLSVLQHQTTPDKSTRDVSPASGDDIGMDDSIMNTSMSETLKNALKDLRTGSEAILRASNQLNLTTSAVFQQNGHNENKENFNAEREQLLGKIDFLRENINQLVLTRDSLEMALRHMEAQNEDLRGELEMLKKEDQMADQGKDLLLSLLKKTEAELAELHARYRQRDLRLEIEQAGREREEQERERLQKELRETEVQLVRVKGELRQKDAQYERERILTMWKKDNDEQVDVNRNMWKTKCLRAESYRKNLVHQKRYLITLIDDIIINSTDEFCKKIALDGIRPASMRRTPATGVLNEQRKKLTFKSASVVVCAVLRLKTTNAKWQQVRGQAGV
ncbi:hypothetical protein RvY_10064 [Ramazzottius varieornatus]|uniref:Pericentrin/AKAP-450 centrosomal targeting domain-containing protein n=1 Tax=Ramazzottius varieornatus TaxID=947166 RepID=A0A1D1VG12_RAMVA|nr:hypothetical protein RvY_10064 [Ramazzottius varieornatus]